MPVAIGATAMAAPIEPGQSAPIVGAQSGRCLTVPGSSAPNGTQPQLQDCTGAVGQTWTYTAHKQLTVHGNKCLDANGTRITLWSCHGGTNLQWSRR
ncbi:ricin-type beta-trefoil lectin domain protein [Streptomyces sp. NPDC058642]|uniref:ricin-type beta-trefoil lectin domain protein n=1 Tax=Streptomyces sp. NPDC058642 TaxID=3346572 RepID=UPI003661D0D4